MMKVQVISILTDMIERYGIQILWEPRFCAIFSDLAPNLKREREIFHEIFEKQLELLIKKACRNENNRIPILRSLHQALRNEIGLTEQNANCVMNWYMFAVGWDLDGLFGEDIEIEAEYRNIWKKYDFGDTSWVDWEWKDQPAYPKFLKKEDRIIGYCWSEREWYEGELVECLGHYVADGRGKLVTPDGIYEGIFVFPYGIEEKKWICKQGRFFGIDHSFCEGNFINGKCEGRGKYVSPCTGVTYEGEFKNGKFHGYGKRKFLNGKLEDGMFLEGKFTGKAK